MKTPPFPMIKRIDFLLLAVVGLFLTSAAGLYAADSAPRYNVLFLMTDEHNPNVLGCAGDPLVKTPALDSLAASGVRMTASYCQNPVCVPSRSSLVSSRMPSNLSVFGNGAMCQYKGITTLADVFVQAGYQVAWMGKTHWGEPRFPKENDEGASKRNAIGKTGKEESANRLPQEAAVSSWPVEQNPEHITTESALRFLEKNRDKPFFLGVSFSKPHFPYTIQQNYYDMYAGKVSLPHASQKLIDELPTLSKNEREKYGLGDATEEEVLRAKAMYYGMVTYVDDEFGRLLKKLDELGLRENTVIVYTADHGEMLGDRGLWYKNSFYEGSARIPNLWSFPKALPRGTVINAPTMNMDIFPTLCELAHLPIPAGQEGKSLVSLMQGKESGADRQALVESYREGFAGRMIRTARWKYFCYTNGEEYLYDMQADPGEENNLITKPELRKTADELKQNALAGWVGVPANTKPQSDDDDAPVKSAKSVKSNKTKSKTKAKKDE